MTKTKDDFKIKGSFIATLRHKDGSVEVRRKDNLILNGGFDFICDAIANSSRGSVMGYTAVGTGTTAVAATQTGLTTELRTHHWYESIYPDLLFRHWRGNRGYHRSWHLQRIFGWHVP